MATISPTTSVMSREIIGVELFSQRREVFGKHDTVFLPPSPPTSPAIDNGNMTSNFKRNTSGYSSMRESRTEDRNIEFRPRKYSDNFTSELNQSDDVDYRYSMTERTRRLSKLRRDFLNSNLHEPSTDFQFNRTGTRASMPAPNLMRYKIESPNLYKFPFAEPYATPPPVRKVVVDLGPVNGEKENQDPEVKTKKHQSLPNYEHSPKIDRQKLFEELVKRYSPQRKPIDWKLPPTRPRVVGSVPKSFSSVADSIDGTDGTDKKISEEALNKTDDDVFIKKEKNVNPIEMSEEKSANNSEENAPENFTINSEEKIIPSTEISLNGPDIIGEELPKNDVPIKELKASLAEFEEKNDAVPELSNARRLSGESVKKPPLEKYTDLTIPALIEKMTEEAEELENHKKGPKKMKRKRSFLDKLLGRNKKEK